MAERPPPRFVEPRPVSLRDVTPGGLVGIDRALIERVVQAFYVEIRADSVLGPIFSTVIAETRWPTHLANMVEFWCSVLLLTGSYKGRPVPAHLPLRLVDSHFRHWLDMFETVTQRLCPPAAAALFMARAERIADSLRMAGAMAERGGLPRLVEPLQREKSAASLQGARPNGARPNGARPNGEAPNEPVTPGKPHAKDG